MPCEGMSVYIVMGLNFSGKRGLNKGTPTRSISQECHTNTISWTSGIFPYRLTIARSINKNQILFRPVANITALNSMNSILASAWRQKSKSGSKSSWVSASMTGPSAGLNFDPNNPMRGSHEVYPQEAVQTGKTPDQLA